MKTDREVKNITFKRTKGKTIMQAAAASNMCEKTARKGRAVANWPGPIWPAADQVVIDQMARFQRTCRQKSSDGCHIRPSQPAKGRTSG